MKESDNTMMKVSRLESGHSLSRGNRFAERMSPKKLQVAKISIPPYFRCPISLDLMRDPVSLCTGVSYDRSSIEKWLSDGNNTCPATMQVLDNHDLIPNHTLRRLIQEWCVANAPKGVERIPTPKQPVELQQAKVMVKDISEGFMQVETLRLLRGLATESDRNMRLLLDAGVVSALVSIISSEVKAPGVLDILDGCEEALGLMLAFSNCDQIRQLAAEPKVLDRICWFLSEGRLDAQIYAASILESLCSGDEDVKLKVGSTERVMEALLSLLTEHQNPKALCASLSCLLTICSLRRNRLRAIEAGAVPCLIELLLADTERSVTERTLSVLEVLCMCADGRAAVVKISKAITAIVNTLLRVSQAATERAVSVLWSVCHHAPEKRFLSATVEAGLFSKLFLLIQSECRPATKRQASELLKLLRETWEEFLPYVPNDHGLPHIMAS
ncbi:hypothetical protein MPTK1_7g11020 [Marchantia polymorpha subsp. ruderalis]|uniref:RING-type E3 ubiquitin transferase n=2 Tax=Marchantia polymorpha TaxID=3197 RepID=A0AAF6BYA3_MARPO|nr:hypothetical protein MARPO_0003s0116 [Marchantia polymorpha]BBN16987.1 hypothetical protein Mp_7g11020 [Marchantia polymorpha subsp. ruderalis]|eukprot:PTQ49224.1 hypothetical protein MARPO_0003s0116 [Marchantia polymorpha]